MNLEEYKKNHKTAYLAQMYEKLMKNEAELLSLMEKDFSMKEMKELAQNDLNSIKEQKKNIEEQIKIIIESEKEEIELPTELILEVRAGTGGDEATLFAQELFPKPHPYWKRI